MNRAVTQSLADVDAVVLVIKQDARCGPISPSSPLRQPYVVVALNKVDELRERICCPRWRNCRHPRFRRHRAGQRGDRS
jgi:GTPase Era involved in 16S rRNA processing